MEKGYVIDSLPPDILGKNTDGDIFSEETETKIISILDDLKYKRHIQPLTIDKFKQLEDEMPNNSGRFLINPKDPQRSTKDFAHVLAEFCNAGDFSLLDAMLGLNKSE